jgi:hypothetical protein
MDAVHPTHAARPVGCWGPAKENLAIEQTSGRQTTGWEHSSLRLRLLRLNARLGLCS